MLNKYLFRNPKVFFLPFLSSLLLIFSFPNFNIELLAWVAFIPLFAAIEGRSPKDALLTGWLTGFLFYLGLIYWLVDTMGTYGGLPYPIGILALIVFALYLGLYYALFAWALSLFKGSMRGVAWASAPFVWTALEFIRTYFLTGFPWGVIGYSQFLNLPIVQIADITGVYGVSFLLVLVNVCLYLLCCFFLDRFVTGVGSRYKILYSVCSVFVLMGVLVYGNKTIAQFTGSEGKKVKVAMIQGNIDQAVKWDPDYKNETMSIYRNLSLKSAEGKPDLIVWPETATPFFFQKQGVERRRVVDTVIDTNTFLLFGSPAVSVGDSGLETTNRAYLIAPEGKEQGFYDKIHLVPLGEYVPLKSVFFFIDKIVQGIGDFVPGKELTVFELPKGRFSVLICYELIFPDLSRKFVEKGAEFLVNITNDAWFGRTGAPWQHLSMAVFRSIENRVPLVRAANTGISGIVSATGVIKKTSPLFEKATVEGTITLIKKEDTVYTRYGDLFAYVSVALTIFVLLSHYIYSRGIINNSP